MKIRTAAFAALLLAGCSSSVSQAVVPTASTAPYTPALYAYVPGAKTLVATYLASASGKTAPQSVLQGRKTQLQAGVGGFALGTDGTGYVLESSPGELLAFASGASGNTAPVRTAMLNQDHLGGFALDQSGNFWTVQSCFGSQPPACGNLLRYSLSISGTAQPNLQFQPQLDTPVGMLPAIPSAVATDAKGDVYCVCVVLYEGSQGIGITQYHISATGKPSIVRSFYDFSLPQIPPQTLHIDAATGAIYAASTFQPFIFAYAANQRTGEVMKRRIIYGPNTTLQTIASLTTDPSGALYVGQPQSILVFDKNANFDVKPVRAIVDLPRLQYQNQGAGSFLLIH